MKSFSLRDRSDYISRLKNEKFDLLIVGGGITGAGVARDAASRGMKVALIEARDFASGTSSRSSKLVHGGIRYLENKEFGLVFEALSERAKLFKLAPHLVHPLRFMLPVYEGGRVGMGLMGLGMWLYDALALFRSPEMHERLNSAESVERMPSLQPKGLLGSYVYSDAYMDDDRLTLETMRSANAYGATCVSYCSAIGADFDKNQNAKEKIHSVKVRDEIGGDVFSIRAHHVVSSVGPWTDDLGNKLLDGWKSILRPTKGVHLTFAKNRLPLSSAVVMATEKGNRIVFGIPRHEMIIVGTTDTDFRDNPQEVVTTEEDVAYLLKVIDEYFPGANIEAKDILASYAGVRPLVKDNSDSEGKTSREHVIIDDDRGITLVAGGKYTTYRKMAQDVVEKVLSHFDFEDRVRFSHSLTEEPINPMVTQDSYDNARDRVDELARNAHISTKHAQLMLDRHGLEAFEIVQKFNQKMSRELSYWQFEALHAIENCMCFSLVDFYTRRVPLFLSHADHGLEVLDDVCDIFRDYLGWDSEIEAQQRRLLQAHIDRELAWVQKIRS